MSQCNTVFLKSHSFETLVINKQFLEEMAISFEIRFRKFYSNNNNRNEGAIEGISNCLLM